MRLLRWVPFVLFSAAILLYSTDWSTRDLDYVSNMIEVWDPSQGDYLWTAYNKTRHIVAFVLLGLATFPLKKRGPDGFRFALLCCALVASSSELVQRFSEIHRARLFDVAVNMVASLFGVRLVFTPRVFGRVPAPPIPESIGLSFGSEGPAVPSHGLRTAREA